MEYPKLVQGNIGLAKRRHVLLVRYRLPTVAHAKTDGSVSMISWFDVQLAS